MKKKIKFALIISLVSIVIVGITFLIIKKYNSYKYYKYKETVLEVVPGIICWGDSLTGGADGDYMSYPELMSQLIEEEYCKIPVANMGVGGEDSITICGRAGSIPFRVKEFTIKKDTEPIRITFYDNYNKKVTPINNYDGRGINHCYINGVCGDLSAEYNNDEIVYYFTRLEDGEEVFVPDYTPVITAQSSQCHDYITIIFMGANGGYDDADDLILQQESIINMMDPDNSKYLIITSTGGNYAENYEIEDAMLRHYGDKYLNLRQYLCDDGFEDLKNLGFNISVTEEDLDNIKNGFVPASLRMDYIHYNEIGTIAVSHCIYNKLKSLGYFEGIPDK